MWVLDLLLSVGLEECLHLQQILTWALAQGSQDIAEVCWGEEGGEG